MPAAKKRKKWPQVVKIGSATALIYRDRYGKKIGRRRRFYERFTVVHYRVEGETRTRCRRSFNSLHEARDEATRIATAIANSEADVLKLTNADRTTYLHAVEALRPLNIPLHVAVAEYIEARRHAGAGLIAVAKEYARRHQTETIRVSVSEAAREMLAAKKQDGMSVRYLQSLRSHLNRFGEHFQMNVSTVTAAHIDDWLRKIKCGPRTRNNIRLSIVTLFNFAKARGYLPKTFATEADHVAKAKDRGGDIGIFQPEKLAKLLGAGDEEANLYVAIGAFTGLRSAELIRLEWQDVNFARGHIQVAKSKSKTATRRLVSIQPNLMEWLAPYRGKTGKVFVSEHAAARAIAPGQRNWNRLAQQCAPAQLRDVSTRAISRRRARGVGNGQFTADAFSQLPRARGRTRSGSLVFDRSASISDKRSADATRAIGASGKSAQMSTRLSIRLQSERMDNAQQLQNGA